MKNMSVWNMSQIEDIFASKLFAQILLTQLETPPTHQDIKLSIQSGLIISGKIPTKYPKYVLPISNIINITLHRIDRFLAMQMIANDCK